MALVTTSPRSALRSAAPWIVLGVGLLLVVGAVALASRPLSPSCGNLFWAIRRTMAAGDRPFFGPTTVRCLEPAEERWQVTWSLLVVGVALVGGSTTTLRRRRPGADLLWYTLPASLLVRAVPFLLLAAFVHLLVAQHVSLRFLGD